MDSKDLQQLANIASVKNHIASILNTGRGVVPKPQLHKLQQEGMKLDKMFVDLLLSSSSQQDKDDIEDINKRIAEEKSKLDRTSVKRISVEEATVAAVNDSREAPVKKLKKNVKTSKEPAANV